MANAIKWIARRAKQLKRSRPNKHHKYTGYIKDAAAEYRRKSKPRKKSAPRKKKVRRATRSVARKIKHRPRRKMSGTLGSLTATQHVSRAKDLIAQKIANLELRKFTSRTKTEKRKIARAIRDLKRSYSKLRT